VEAEMSEASYVAERLGAKLDEVRSAIYTLASKIDNKQNDVVQLGSDFVRRSDIYRVHMSKGGMEVSVGEGRVYLVDTDEHAKANGLFFDEPENKERCAKELARWFLTGENP
jgi:hypothetical protein